LEVNSMDTFHEDEQQLGVVVRSSQDGVPSAD